MNHLSLKNNQGVVFKTAQAYQMPTAQTSPENKNPLPDVKLPDLYYTPKNKREKKSFKERIKQWDMLNVIYPWLAHPFLMLGACGVMSVGVDKFSEACGG